MGGLETLARLKDLWLNDNKLGDLGALDCALAGCRQSLRGVYFCNNPLAADKGVYKAALVRLLPNLEELDGEDVVRESR